MSEREQFEAWWKTTGRALCGCSLVPDHTSPNQVLAARGFGAGFAAGFEAARAQPAQAGQDFTEQLREVAKRAGTTTEHDCYCGRKWKHTAYGWASTEPAQAGQVLTDDALWELWNAQGCDDMNQSEAMKFARAIEQAVLAKRVPQWLPIETAPKDGTRVILAWGGKSINGFYLDNSKTRTPWQGWRVESMVVQPSGVPAHWMPLPPPPGIVSEKGGA